MTKKYRYKDDDTESEFIISENDITFIPVDDNAAFKKFCQDKGWYYLGDWHTSRGAWIPERDTYLRGDNVIIRAMGEVIFARKEDLEEIKEMTDEELKEQAEIGRDQEIETAARADEYEEARISGTLAQEGIVSKKHRW